MERKYPTKMFWLFVFTNFLFHFFYLSIPGIILCVVGIWVKPCLWIGVTVLGLDAILSIIEQLRIRKAAVSHSDNPEFNELMDAFCGPDGFDAVRSVLDEKIKTAPVVEEDEKN
jgi:fatty acid desaturase